MFGAWLNKVKNFANGVIGKVKSGIGYASQLFNKGKDMYNNVKEKVTSLPVVGGIASNLIGRGENALNDYAKKQVGHNFHDAERLLGKAESFANQLPTIH